MIRFEGSDLYVGGSVFTLEYPIQEARLLNDLIVVLFKPDSYKGPGQFHNLVAYGLDGRKKWEAELPTSYSMDSYYKLVSSDRLIADSCCSYRCEIDLASGRIVTKEFYK